MEISERNIKRISEMKPAGDFDPYRGGDEEECEQYGLKVVRKIEGLNLFEVSSEVDDYGSGYASYYDVFVTKKDGSAKKKINGLLEVEGVTIFISKLAPMAAFGYTKKIFSANSTSSSVLTVEGVGKLPAGDWNKELHEIRNILNIYRISILSKAELETELWFKVSPPTVFDCRCVFDALFYWED